MKKIISISLILISLFYLGNTAKASEINTVEYDLYEGNNLNYEVIDEQGNTVIIEIERISPLNRIAKGTYKISKTLKNRWSITYYIDVNTKDQITGATGLNAKAISGSFISTSLTSSTSSANCYFKQKVGTVTSTGNVTASISKGKLIVN